MRERRDLLRRRVHLVEDRNRLSNRIHRLLELQKIRLSSVLGKVTGATSRSILYALATAGRMKPAAFALLATHKRVRTKREQPGKALHTHLTDHFRFLLRELREELDGLTGKISCGKRESPNACNRTANSHRAPLPVPGINSLTALDAHLRDRR